MIKTIKEKLFRTINHIQIKLIKKNKNIKGMKNAKLYGKPIFTTKEGSSIYIGDNFMSISKAKYNVIGVYSKTIIRTLSKDAKIVIGNNVGASGASIIAHKSISIGNGVLIGANVTIIDNDFHPIKSNNRRYEKITEKDYRGVVIEDNVFIGMNSIILKGSHIKKNAVIGANSVITGVVEENSIMAGNPAKLIKIIK